MTKIAELTEKVTELMKEIETLKQQEKAEEFEYPFEENETYFTVCLDGDITNSMWTNHCFDTTRYYQGNAFKTKQEAERERDKRVLLTRFRQFRDKCNGDWKPDFNDISWKWHLAFNHLMHVMKIYSCCNLEEFHLFGYFKKEADARRALELFGDEIKRLYVEVEE